MKRYRVLKNIQIRSYNVDTNNSNYGEVVIGTGFLNTLFKNDIVEEAAYIMGQPLIVNSIEKLVRINKTTIGIVKNSDLFPLPLKRRRNLFSNATGENAKVSGKIIILNPNAPAGEAIKGMEFPDKITDFPLPATVVFAPGYTPYLYKPNPMAFVSGQVGGTYIPDKISPKEVYTVINITSISGNKLVTDEGWNLSFVSRGKGFSGAPVMAISQTKQPTQKISTDLVAAPPTGSLGASIVENFGSHIKKTQTGIAIASWAALGLVAYKKWGSSNLWKTIIVGWAVANSISTYNMYNEYKSN